MKNVLLIACVLVGLISSFQAKAQTCSGTISNGQNLVTNGDFSEAYSGWTHDPAYTQYTYCSNCYSSPGNIYASTSQDNFNPGAFPNFPDHTATADNYMLMVDGVCTNGINLWSQSNIPLVPNTNYFFSVWIASMSGSPKELGKLNFNINGLDLGTNITAPGTTGTWIKYTAVWNSGLTPPATAVISIQNTNTVNCNTGVDFIIDDISFSPGCDFGGPSPLPNLGPDFSVCGKTFPINITPNFNAATAAAGNITYTWYKNGVQVSSGLGSSFNNFNITAAPVGASDTYSVCVDSAGNCPKTDQLTITKSYSIDLGPDQTLCDPIVAALDAVYTGPGVTYTWFNGGSVISGATSSTFSVNTPGTYSVTVHDPSCGDKSSSLVITTLAATPQNGTFCPTSGTGKASLSVSGPGKYKWWTAATGGTALATGPSYTTPLLAAPGPYTYYVQDTSTFKVTAGPPAIGNGMVNSQSISAGSRTSKLIFNALTSFKLDSMTVLPFNYYCPTPGVAGTGNNNTISFIVYDSVGGIVATSPLFTATCTGQGTPAPPLKVPVGINIPQGNGYQIELNTGSSQFAIYLNTTNGGNPPSPELYHYPTTYSGAVQFVGNSSQDYSLYYSPDAFPGYFDWKITKGVNCQRVPVIASMDCPSCVTTVAPTSISSTSTTFCTGSVATIDIVIGGGSGDSLILYKGSCGGARIDSIATAASSTTFTIPAPTTTTTYFARWKAAPNCLSTCVSLIVTPVTPIVQNSSNAGPNQNICNTTSTTLHAVKPAVGIGAWSVVSGTGSITNTTDSLSGVTGIGAGDLILKWKVTDSPCPADSSNVTIHRNVSVIPDSIGKIAPYCNNGSVSTINLTVFGGSGDSLILYKGSCGGTRVDSNSTGAPFLNIPAPTTATTYFARWESANNCKSACVSFTVTPVTPITPNSTNAGTNQNICNTTIASLHAKRPLIGIGAWSVVSGIGTVTTLSDSLSGVTGIGAGDLVLKWKATDSPCPADSGNVTIHSTISVVPDSIGKIASYCNNGSTSTINLTVYGGSGDSLILYKGSCGGTRVDSNSTGVPFLNIPAPTTATTYFARWESANNCQSACVSLTITPVELPSISNPGTVAAICNSTTARLHATRPVIGTGIWSVVSGTGTVTTPTDSLSNVSGIGAGNLVLAWTVSNSPCPSTSNQVTIQRDILPAPVITGSSFDTCASTTGVNYSTTIDNSPNSTYNWTTSVAGTLSITSQSTNTASVNIGASGGKLYVTETFGACILTDSATITIAPNIVQPVFADSVLTTCVTSGQLIPDSILVGAGHWTVSTGSAIFTDANDPHTFITGLGTGIDILTWTVSGCGGPKSANIVANVASSNIVLHATGPLDTVCIGNARDMGVTVSGGSGGFKYSWSSSNNSFNTVTKKLLVTVSPQSNLVTYYVFATDTVNNGCLSNVDSVQIHTVASQVLFNNNLITPNRDGLNEKLIVTDLNTHQAVLPGTTLDVYNRWGERVFKSESYDNNWDATGLTDGVYYYNMKAGCGGGDFKGWIQIMGSGVVK